MARLLYTLFVLRTYKHIAWLAEKETMAETGMQALPRQARQHREENVNHWNRPTAEYLKVMVR